MKKLIILGLICFLSCEKKATKKDCLIDFKILEDSVHNREIITDLKLRANILKVSVFNSGKDTLYFASPYIIFAQPILNQSIEERSVIRRFIPNVVTVKTISYYMSSNNKKEIISIDSSKTREKAQYEVKLPPKIKVITEYVLNCEESDADEFKIYFFESNRFDSGKYTKIKYPEGGILKIRRDKK